MKELSGLSLTDILPSSIASDPQVKTAAQALDPELQSVSRDIREVLILPRIDELSEPVVDLLAWQWHVDFYELARTLEMKRAMVKDSIAWHRKKGTKWAIKKALSMIGVEAEITEWWKIEGAKPYTFAVDAWLRDPYNTTNPNGAETLATVRRAIEESKAARSWLLRLRLGIGFEEDLRVVDDEDFALERLIVLTEPYPWPGPLHDGTHRYGAALLYDAAHDRADGLFHDRRRPGTLFHSGSVDLLSPLEISLSAFDEPLASFIYYEGFHRHDAARRHGREAGPVDDGLELQVVRRMLYNSKWLHDQPGFRYNSLKLHDKLENHEGSGVRNGGTPRTVRV